jgi:CBS domain containing-hemolysin-like protein
MRTFLWVIVGLDQLFLLLIGAVKLQRYALSEFAFRQQLEHHSGEAAKLRRSLYKLLPEVQLLQRVELVIAGAVSVALLTHLNRPIFGFAYALLAMTVVVCLSQFNFVQRLAEDLFEASLPIVIKVTTSLHLLWVLLGIPKQQNLQLPGSQAEFTDQLRRLPSTVLNPLQRQRLESVLAAEDKTVADIMTAKKRVVTVEPSATLGPVLLSDLQKSGHGYFPVATKKGEPIGVLALSELADIHAAKQRASVKELMSEQVAWAEESTPLYTLASLFLSEKQYLILVKNSQDEFVGVVSLADLMKHVLTIVQD